MRTAIYIQICVVAFQAVQAWSKIASRYLKMKEKRKYPQKIKLLQWLFLTPLFYGDCSGLTSRPKTVTVSLPWKKLLVSSTSCYKRIPNCVQRYKFLRKNISGTLFFLFANSSVDVVRTNITLRSCAISEISLPILVGIFQYYYLMLLVSYHIDASLITMSSGRNQKVSPRQKTYLLPEGAILRTLLCFIESAPKNGADDPRKMEEIFANVSTPACSKLFFFPPLSLFAVRSQVLPIFLCVVANRLSSTWIKRSYHAGKVF